MKILKGIVLEEETELCGDRIGFCRDIGRYVLKHRRGFPCEYFAFYFLTREQAEALKRLGEDVGTGVYSQMLSKFVTFGTQAGAEYIRDYSCSPNFRSPDGPLSCRWDGPYFYDGERLNWIFSSGSDTYAVPPLDFNLNRKLRAEGKTREEYYRKLGFLLRTYDENKAYAFFGKVIK